ncbi:hypothetical protein M0R04_14655 [Candidatus Dojkabacteria bacterium]|jgi:hypothetical protein|nr:hypothetical protein [Candidatus Dojkabacteria bacterium]
MKTETQHIVTIEWIYKKLLVLFGGLCSLITGLFGFYFILIITKRELIFVEYLAVMCFGVISGGLIIFGCILMAIAFLNLDDMPKVKVKVEE